MKTEKEILADRIAEAKRELVRNQRELGRYQRLARPYNVAARAAKQTIRISEKRLREIDRTAKREKKQSELADLPEIRQCEYYDEQVMWRRCAREQRGPYCGQHRKMIGDAK